ncbi:MAG: polysaccharide deacetylase family protein [Clostridiales Family XIII bacterium]|jgi:peptidoglycan/xylan/chitin deacetylase (PgdA/CDA1 family)|nr:polysaccharide deacetylase family protein [Clostridiales Family XIII bacterium]
MGCKKYFTLSFDDGVEQDKKIIALMKRYGLHGTFNLNSGLFGYRPKLFNINRIPKDEIKQVYEGFEVASHGARHENPRTVSRRRLEASIAEDIEELSGLVGYRVKGHAYPYGFHTAAGEECLRGHGVLYARRIRGSGSFLFPANPYRYDPTCWFNAKNVFRLIDGFIQARPENGDLLFMMWGHGYEMDYGLRKCPEDQLERIFSKIAGRSDIVYCSNKEAFERDLQ